MQTEPEHPAATGCTDAERVSAWIDGELDEAETIALFARVHAHGALRECWSRHHIASDALRASDVAACHSSQLQARIAAALAEEPTLLAPVRFVGGRRVRRWAVPVLGVAAAAAFLALGLPHVMAPDPIRNSAVAGQASAGPAQVTVLAVPVDPAATNLRPANSASGDPRLAAYLRAHREMEEAVVMPRAVRYLRAEDDR